MDNELLSNLRFDRCLRDISDEASHKISFFSGMLLTRSHPIRILHFGKAFFIILFHQDCFLYS
jgi:hypothetical protein